MERAFVKIWRVLGLLVLIGLASSQGLAQEPRALMMPKQQLTSLRPYEDATIGAAPPRARALPMALHSSPRHFQAPGWDFQPHQYLVLDRQGTKGVSHRSKPDNAPILQPRPVEPYAYGWFGAKMNRHPHRSFGFQHAYTQWAFE